MLRNELMLWIINWLKLVGNDFIENFIKRVVMEMKESMGIIGIGKVGKYKCLKMKIKKKS